MNKLPLRLSDFFSVESDKAARNPSGSGSTGKRSPVRAILAATGTAIAATVLQSSKRSRIDERLEVRSRQLAALDSSEESSAAAAAFGSTTSSSSHNAKDFEKRNHLARKYFSIDKNSFKNTSGPQYCVGDPNLLVPNPSCDKTCNADSNCSLGKAQSACASGTSCAFNCDDLPEKLSDDGDSSVDDDQSTGTSSSVEDTRDAFEDFGILQRQHEPAMHEKIPEVKKKPQSTKGFVRQRFTAESLKKYAYGKFFTF